MLPGDADRLRAGGDVQLLVEVGDVPLYGAGAEGEVEGDLLVASAGDELLEDLALGEGDGGGCDEAGDEAVGDDGGDEGASGVDGANGLGEVVAVDVLEEVAAGAGAEAIQDLLVFDEDGEEDGARLAAEFAEALKNGDADDFHAIDLLQHVADAAADHLVVVDEEDADARLAGTGALIFLAVGLGGGVQWWDAALGFVAFPGVVLAAHGLWLRYAGQKLQATSELGFCLGMGAIAALLIIEQTQDAALLFFGNSLLLAAAKGYAGCEVLAISNWLLRRDDQVGCLLYSPLDQLEARLTGSRRSLAP